MAQQFVAAQYHQDRAVWHWVWILFFTLAYIGHGAAEGIRGSR